MITKKILTSFLLLIVCFGVAGCETVPTQPSEQITNEKENNQPKIDTNDNALDIDDVTNIETKKDSQSDEPEIITTDIDTSDWVTYKNEEYGFELEYPTLLNNRGKEDNRIYFFDDKHLYTFHVEVLNGKLEKNKIESIIGFVPQENIEEITIAGKQAYRFRDGDMGCGGYDYRITLDENKTLRMFFVSCDDTEFIYEKQIINSFKY